MTRILSFFVLLATSLSATGQADPVKWSFSSSRVSDHEYVITFTADIQKNWVIYSQFLESDNGPIPTSFSFNEANGIELVGQAEESGKIKEEYDDLFEMVLKKLSGTVRFEQKVKTTDNTPRSVSGYLTYMTCDNQRCLPPKDVSFSIDLR